MFAIHQQPSAEQRRLADIRRLIDHHRRRARARARVDAVLQAIAREAGVTVAEARAYALAELEKTQ